MPSPMAVEGADASSAITPSTAKDPAAQLQALSDELFHPERIVDFPAASAIGQVKVRQLPGKALGGACVRTADMELACFVERRYAGRLAGLRVLELGSGTALTAIALARLGARVTATNLLPELVALAEENASRADLRLGHCTSIAHVWGESLHGQMLAPFDLVVGSEITCNEGSFQPLIQTLSDLCEATDHPPPTILIAETLTTAQQLCFWALAGEHFAAREVGAFSQRDAWNVRDTSAPVRILELHPHRMSPAVFIAKACACPKVEDVPGALDALQEHGACVLAGCGTTSEDAVQLPTKLFGKHLVAAPVPAEVSNRVLAGRGILKEESFRAHTDGHAYGDLFPDFFLLLCSKACASGGANFLVDGYAVLDTLAADAATAWVPSALELRAVDQTSRLPSITPVVLRAPCGRRALRCRLSGPPLAFAAQRVAKDSDNPEADAAMLKAYHEAVDRAAKDAPRLTLGPGDALIVDNYRMFHGRDPFCDEDRLLWRVWIWTDGARGVPSGELHSTPGDKAGAVTHDQLHSSTAAAA